MPVPRGGRGAGRRARRAPGGGGLPIRRHRAPVAAVPPRYVAEVGLYARFPVHVQLPDHVVAHGRLLPKDLDLLGSSVGPRAVVELVKMRWRDWRAYGGANGQSALAEMAVFAVAPATAPGSRAAAWRSWPAATALAALSHRPAPSWLWRLLHKDGLQGPVGNDCATWGNADDSAESARAPE